MDPSEALRLFVSALLAAVIGFDREVKQRPAGLRTHILVGVAATLLVLVGETFIVRYRDLEAFHWEPTRLLEAIVTGVSFLGAGTIVIARGKGRVHGLTTAASVLATAIVGIAVGLERYALAVTVTVLLVAVLVGLDSLERRIAAKAKAKPPVAAE